MQHRSENPKHLRLEEIEAVALEGGQGLPRRSSAHAAECERCREEAGELARLHAALTALASLQPGVGLADRVMRSVTLPRPWRERAVASLREHWAATAAVIAGLAGALGLGLTAASRYPELTPITVGAFLIERASALAWSGVMEIGQLVYRTGMLAAAQSAAEQLTVATAFVAVATVTLVGLGALRIMLSLMDISTGAHRATGG